MTGTPAGVGHVVRRDVIVGYIDGVGSLTVKVVWRPTITEPRGPYPSNAAQPPHTRASAPKHIRGADGCATG